MSVLLLACRHVWLRDDLDVVLLLHARVEEEVVSKAFRLIHPPIIHPSIHQHAPLESIIHQHAPNTLKTETGKEERDRGTTYLPILHLILLRLVLLDQLRERLAQPVRVGLQDRHHFLHRALREHAVDHAEAFAVARERDERF